MIITPASFFIAKNLKQRKAKIPERTLIKIRKLCCRSFTFQ